MPFLYENQFVEISFSWDSNLNSLIVYIVPFLTNHNADKNK